MAIRIPIITNFDSKGLKQAESKLSKFGRAANVALAGVAGAAVTFAKAAAEDAASAATLEKTLQNVTGATSKQTAQVEKYISKLTLATGVSDDELRPSLDRLVRATGDVTKAQELQALALDISAGTGKSLSTVTEALAKAQGGQLTALKKLGIQIDEATLKSGNFETVQTKLAKTFEGQSATAAETAQGKFKRFNVAIQEAQEEIGYAFLPVIQELLPYILKLAKFLSNNTDLVLKLAAVITALAVTIKVVQGVTILWNAVQLVMEANAKRAAAGQLALNAALLANPVVLIVAGVIALVAALVLAYKKSETFRNIVNGAFEWVKKAAANTLEFFKKIPGFFIKSGKTLVNLITTPYRLAFAGIAKLWNATIGGLEFKVPSWIPGIGGKGFTVPKLPEGIPALANGGIVTKPTLALIGEAGAEAVVPLTKKNSPMGAVNNFYINGKVLDPEGTARSINRILTQSQRRAGAF